MMIDKNKYIDLLNNTEKDLNSIKELMDYINLNKPKTIFRYRSCTENTIEAFRNDELYFNTADNFNDPYDSLVYCNEDYINKSLHHLSTNVNKDLLKYIVSNPQSLGQAPSQFPQETIEQININMQDPSCIQRINSLPENFFKEVISRLEAIYKQTNLSIAQFYQKQMPIACFSEKYDNILMWSHYADYHKGFVLEYDTDNLQTKCINCPEKRDFTSCLDWQETMFLPVVYTNNRYDATNYVIDNTNKRFFAEMGIRLNCRASFAQYKINIFKHKCWSYEREWRLMLYKMNDTKKLYNKTPVAIYLGCRIKKCYEDILVKYAREKGIKIYKMSENPTRLKYNLNCKPYKN